jgi:hypothetical protein
LAEPVNLQRTIDAKNKYITDRVAILCFFLPLLLARRCDKENRFKRRFRCCRMLPILVANFEMLVAGAMV